MLGEDFRIVSDVTTAGVRHVTAIPSALVCSRQIDFDLEEGRIRHLRYTGGCHGNLQAIGALLEGQPVEFALDRLDGMLTQTQESNQRLREKLAGGSGHSG